MLPRLRQRDFCPDLLSNCRTPYMVAFYCANAGNDLK